MNKNSSKFCIMPHIALAMQNNGDISVCNVCQTILSYDEGNGNLADHSIDKFWHSKTKKNIIQDLDNDVEHSGCSSCWDLEKTGNISSRQRFNAEFGNLQDIDKPQVLIMKPGNICNSACRTCVPETSSSLYSDYYKLHLEKNKNVTFKEYIKKFENVQKSFAKDSSNFWPYVNEWYENLYFLDIYGGEPFVTPNLWESLQYAVDSNFSKSINLQLHTNAMIYDEKKLNLLSNFKTINIGLSIDSHLENEFNYIRHKSDYTTVIENCKKFMDFKNKHNNFKFNIIITPSILNIWNLDKTVITLEKLFNISVAYTNFVYTPNHYDIRHLPRAVKQKIIKKFDNPKFIEVTNFINDVIPGCEFFWPKFCLETEKLDKIRNQKFSEVFPEWYGILEPFWDYKKKHPEWYGKV